MMIVEEDEALVENIYCVEKVHAEKYCSNVLFKRLHF